MKKDKNILFSVDGILGYKENVEKILKEKFINVEYIEEFPLKKDRSLYFKILRELYKKNFFKDYYKKYFSNYQNCLLNKFKDNYFDYFFVVAGKNFSVEFIHKLKEKHKKMKCILFLWDKLEYTDLKKIVKEFDYIFSFEKEDCIKYGFIFRTSFYLEKVENDIKKFADRKYDLFYIGALRDKKRYNIIKEIYDYGKKNGLNFYLKLYVNKNNEKDLPRDYEKNIVIKRKISYQENLDIVKDSKAILDINHLKQLGLSLRNFEAIGNETKIITFNETIKEYDFYDKQNIYYLKGIKEICSIPKDFFLHEYKKIPEEIKKQYTVEGFIDEIFKKVK